MRKGAKLKRAGTFVTALLVGASLSVTPAMASSASSTVISVAEADSSDSSISSSSALDNDLAAESGTSSSDSGAASGASGSESTGSESLASSTESVEPTVTPDPQETGSQVMYRLYNPNSGEHFYTSHKEERDNLRSYGWKYEGIAWIAPEKSSTPVYRLYNPNAGDHHYTTSTEERDNLISVGWRSEDIGWYSSGADKIPVYRLYNPNCKGAGAHHYTTSTEERDSLVAAGWKDENIGWYAQSEGGSDTEVTGITWYNGVDYSDVYNFEYYINKYPDLKAAFGSDDFAAIQHFVRNGMNEARQASENFNVNSYRYEYPDLRQQYHNNLPAYYMHYIEYGKAEGRNATGVTSMQNPVTTYNGKDYSLVYDYWYYKDHNPSAVTACGGDDDYALIAYFVTKGMNLEQQAISTFNEKAYRHNNADLRKAYKSDKAAYYDHFIKYGHNENRDAVNDSDKWIGSNWQKTYNGVDLSPIYDYYYYRDNNPSVVADLTDNDDLLLEYFAKTGILKGQTAKSGVSASSSKYKEILYKLHPELQSRENQIANGLSSDTQYLILVDKSKYRVYVYQGTKGNWTKIQDFACVVGKPSTPSPTGTYKTKDHGYYFNTGGYRCFYWTRITGNYLFHSTIYAQTSTPQREVDGTMSAAASHGCVRLKLNNAYWIYTHISRGTTVYLYK